VDTEGHFEKKCLGYFPFRGILNPESPDFEKNLLGYRFTSKEFAQKGLYYYFGARYYEPVLSVWISADPALEKYLPSDEQIFFPEKPFNPAEDLPGQGGAYYSVNLNLYHYAGLNPIRLIDPDGRCSEEIYKAYGKDVFGRDTTASGAMQRYPDAELIVTVPLVLKAIGIGTITKFIQDIFSEKGSGEEKAKNPYGSKGKPDHQEKVKELENKAQNEARPGEKIEAGTKIKGHKSERRPDVQILDSEGKTRKVFEAERNPGSQRNQKREAEYKKLGVDQETHPLDK
jgi:RHS repeat-associated protein